MQFELLGNSRIEKNRYTISVGECEIVTFTINDRYQSNGHRRPKTTAVHICMHQLGAGSNWGVPNSIPSCLVILDKLGITPIEFLDLLKSLKWGDQLGLVEGQETFL